MFTVKAYTTGKTKIYEAESFTILRSGDESEISMHMLHGIDVRIDVGEGDRPDGWPPFFDRVIIENSNGKTTEIIDKSPNRS